jgi:hypothetical protein
LVILNPERQPLLVVDYKDESWAHKPDKRWAMDTRMREQCHLMLNECPMPRLYGLSFMGTSLRVYCGDKATGDVTPDFVGCTDPNDVLPRDFLEGKWDLNVLSQEGFTKIQEVVSYIKLYRREATNVVE